MEDSTGPGGTEPQSIGVLALQGDVREHARVLSQLGVQVVEVRKPGDLERVDALVIPGGESTAISMLIDKSGLAELLRERLSSGMPAFGTCAGMILLASEVADGRSDQHRFAAVDIAVRRNAFGRQVDSFETELAVEGLAGDFHAVFIRAPLVERVGPGVEVLASVEGIDGVGRPVLCRQGAVLVAAFHPEISGDPRLHEMFLRMASGSGSGSGPATRNSLTTLPQGG